MHASSQAGKQSRLASNLWLGFQPGYSHIRLQKDGRNVSGTNKNTPGSL